MCEIINDRGSRYPQNKKQELRKEAADRGSRIREFRLHIIAIRTSSENGRIITRYLIDPGPELGRGSCYWLPPILHPEQERRAA
jgi:hypothetical protein